MPCAGAEAFLVMSVERARDLGLPHVLLRGAIERHNAYADDPVMMRGGWRVDRDELYAMAGAEPGDMDFVQTYDDYPVIVMIQFEDLGFCDKGDGPAFVRAHRFTWDGSFPNNTSGGQLSAGQAGAAGGFLGMTEAIRQLTGQAAEHAVPGRQARARQRLRHGHLRPLLVHRRGDPRSRVVTPPLVKPKRKNPVLRTRQINLPPSARSRVALGLTAAAAMGRFELQQCLDCGAVLYPPREACSRCASARLRWREQSGDGRVARRHDPASQQRSLLSRAAAVAARAGEARRRADADGSPARRRAAARRCAPERRCAWRRGSIAPGRRC